MLLENRNPFCFTVRPNSDITAHDSIDEPRRPEPHQHTIAFPDGQVLEFNFRAIQLNRLHWRDYLTQPNPVAAALMAKMQIAPADRPKVKVECLRLLATCALTPPAPV